MDDDCNQGKDDYSDIQDRALGTRCVRYYWCANEPCMCAVGALITITSYFCLNIAQYIYVVEYSECFIMDACVFWRSLWGSVVFMYMGIKRSKQLVLTEELFTDGIELPLDRRSEYTYFYILLSCIEYLQWHFCEVCLQKITQQAPDV